MEWNDREGRPPPLVSIVVPVYNVLLYLSQCLDSLVHQTLSPIEIIVVNDASTDGSREIIEQYGSRYACIQAVHLNSNRGIAAARNLGMQYARGHYLSFFDGDDWADIRKYELMYDRAERYGADVVFSGMRHFWDETKSFDSAFFDQHLWDAISPEARERGFSPRKEIGVFLLSPNVPQKLYRRSFLLEHGLEFENEIKAYEDFIFHFEVLWKAQKIFLLDRPLHFYRADRAGSITGRTDRRLFEIFNVLEKITQKLAAWKVPNSIWASLLKVELGFLGWLYLERVPSDFKREFFSACSRSIQAIPDGAFLNYAHETNPDQLIQLFCMRHNLPSAYEKVSRSRWPLYPLLYAALNFRRKGVLKGAFRRWKAKQDWLPSSPFRGFSHKRQSLAGSKGSPSHYDDRQDQLARHDTSHLSQFGEPLVEVCEIDGQTLFFSSKSGGTTHSIARMETDFYLLHTAVFRKGDIVVDIGAGVGVLSLYLAKRYPFIQVYAIEPNPVYFDRLLQNIGLNKLTNVKAIQKALSGDGQDKRLYVHPTDSEWATINSSVAASWPSPGLTEVVKTVTLEQLFSDHKIEYCRVLKLNALGALRESLQGFSRDQCVDFLCGEAYLKDCDRAELEAASLRIARHHFWRTWDQHPNEVANSWVHRFPLGVEMAFRQSSKSS